MEQTHQRIKATESIIAGKIVLIIDSGSYSQRYVWDVYQEFGLETILVDFNDRCYGSSKASQFVRYDYQDHGKDEQHAINIINILQEKQFNIDGCFTNWDDCGPLAAAICERLGLHGSGTRAAKAAKSKLISHNILKLKIDDGFDTSKYSAKCYPINSLLDINQAISNIGLPAVLKPEHGARSIAVKQIKDADECRDMYQKLKLIVMKDHPQIKLGYGDRFMLMEFLHGTKHDIDIVLFQGEIITAIVSDCGPKRHGHFVETTTAMPTCLTPQQEEQLKIAAYQCCCRIGLVHGVFAVEMKMTIEGPKLIEINGRMSGYMSRDWILRCYEIDILLMAFMVCLGIRPKSIEPTAKCQIMGAMCFPSEHREQFEKHDTIELLDDMTHRGMIVYTQLAVSMDDCWDAGNEVPFCNIAVVDSSIKTAKHNLLRIADLLGISSMVNYDFTYFLSEFK